MPTPVVPNPKTQRSPFGFTIGADKFFIELNESNYKGIASQLGMTELSDTAGYRKISVKSGTDELLIVPVKIKVKAMAGKRASTATIYIPRDKFEEALHPTTGLVKAGKYGGRDITAVFIPRKKTVTF